MEGGDSEGEREIVKEVGGGGNEEDSGGSGGGMAVGAGIGALAMLLEQLTKK